MRISLRSYRFQILIALSFLGWAGGLASSGARAAVAENLPRGGAQVLVDDAAPALERFAARELERYLAKLHVSADSIFLIGSPATNSRVRQALGESNWPAVSNQGIVLKRGKLNGRSVLVVGGNSSRATLWAVYELLERWGVRFLVDRDILPDAPVTAAMLAHDAVLEPNLTIRQWRVMNADACGPEAWGMAQYRPLIDQLAKLKINRLYVYIWPWHPFVDFKAGGIARRSGTLWFGEHFPITPDMPGRKLFGADETEFWNPDLPLHGTYEQLHAAGERLLHELMGYAKSRGMDCVLVANLGEFPSEFAPLLKSAQPVIQIGQSGTIVPGPGTRLDDPGLAELAKAVLSATIETYPEADFIELGMQEHRQWAQQYQEAWKELDARRGIEALRPLKTIIADATRRVGYPGGAARAVQEVKGDIVALCFYNRLLTGGAARRRDGSSPRLIFDGVAEELFPVLPRMVPAGSELLNFIDYTPSRILKRKQVLAEIPGRQIPSTLIYTLHDDNVGLLPQLATGSLHALTREIRADGWAGFSTRYWLLGDQDACIAYLSKAAWDADATPESVYADHTLAAYGKAAAPSMRQVFADVEAATVLLEQYGLGFAFPTPTMMIQHWTATPLPEVFVTVAQRYRAARDAAQQAQKLTTSPSGIALTRYWVGRLKFGIGYLEAVELVRRAGAAEAAGKSDEALRLGERALETLRSALESYASVARDRSDRGAIAVMDEYAYRPLQSRLRKMRTKH
jgi:hypothetical protein